MSDGGGEQDFEAAWAEIKLLLDWQRGFAIFLVFGDDRRVGQRLRQRVEDATLLTTRMLQWVRPETAGQAVDTVLRAVFAAGDDQRYKDWRAPLWIELTAGPGDAEWQAARRQTLAALNQRRGVLERDCQRPLFLQLPEAMAPEVVTWAPDLWSIREYVAVLPAAEPEPVPDIVKLESFREDAVALVRDGDTALEGGRIDQALSAARAGVQRFRQLRAALGDTPQALRDLSVSLNRLGDVELNAGRLDAARAAHAESVDLDRQLRAALGDTPPALRDLSVSLNRLGDVELNAGRLDAARAAYAESVDLDRQLRAALGDTPQALRDLSVSLERLGDTERDAGRLDAVRAAYAESLTLRRQLRAALGDTPQALRDLSVSLNKLGDVERDAGRLDAARAAYAESLALCRQLRAALGDTPQALRDLSVSLERLLAIDVALGRAADADVEKELSEVRGRLATAAANLPAE